MGGKGARLPRGGREPQGVLESYCRWTIGGAGGRRRSVARIGQGEARVGGKRVNRSWILVCLGDTQLGQILRLDKTHAVRIK